jgi:hypothetical protein
LSQIDIKESAALIKGIAEVLKVNKMLKIIDLSYNNLTLSKSEENRNSEENESLFGEFVQALKQNEIIVEIDFSGNFRNEETGNVRKILDDSRIKF